MSGQWDESPSDHGGPRSDGESGGVRTDGSGTGAGQVPVPRAGGRAEARRAAQKRGGKERGGAERGGAERGGAERGGAERAADSPVDRTGGRGRKPKRNVKKILAWTAAGVLVLIAGTGGAIYLKLNGNIKTFDADAISKDRPAEAQADANGNKPVNVLLIGSDSRGGSNSDLGGGDAEGARSDTTILLHVYADHKHAVGISIPRNALVTIPSCKLPNGKWKPEQKGTLFNAAFEVGGTAEGNPACTQNTVEKLTGIRVDHTIVVDFQGFSAMTKAVGGVDVCLPKAVYEGDINPKLPKKGAQVLPAGPQKVDGQKALDYVRLRHGIGDGSDIGRMKRQQAFMGSLISAVKKEGLNPTVLLPLADAATKSLRVDPGLDTADKLMSFALSLKNIELHDLKFLTPPWKYHEADLDLVHPDVDNLWNTLKADRTIDGQNAVGEQQETSASPTAEASAQPTTPAPATSTPANTSGAGVRVTVYNGTTSPGLPTKAAEMLRGAKFTVTGTATAKSTNHATTVVEYGTGQKANAEKVAALFPNATLASSTAPGISLILGKDFAAANGGAAGGSPNSAAPSEPTPLPSSLVADARSADDDLCANTTYGSGG